MSAEQAVAVLPDGASAIGLSIAELDAVWPPGPGDDDLTAGEVAIAEFVYAGDPEPSSRADAVADMVPTVRDRTGRVRRGDVAQLAVMTARIQSAGVPLGDRAGLAASLGISA